jgi:tetratricopeptide (TPR) repeat protein
MRQRRSHSASQRFALTGLRRLLDAPNYDPRALVAHYLVRPQGDEFLFEHAMIRDAVYTTLLHSQRRDLHRAAAAWFGDDDLALCAEHLDHAEAPEAPQAYLGAARALAARYDYNKARALAVRGRELAKTLADQSALALCLGDVAHDLGGMAEAREAYEGALSSAADELDRCRALLGLTAVERITDEIDRAFAHVDEAVALSDRPELTLEAARAHHLRGNLLFPRADFEGCFSEHNTALQLAEKAGSAELIANALGGLGDAEYMRGRLESAHAHFRRCVDISRRHGFGRIEVANLPMVGWTRTYTEGMRTALVIAETAITAANKVGTKRAEAIAHHCACYCRAELGDRRSGPRSPSFHPEARVAEKRLIIVHFRYEPFIPKRPRATPVLLLAAVRCCCGKRK